MFGPAAFLWIVFGTIFAGAVHDYLSGMLSLRRDGASLPELVGHELGGGIKRLMIVFALLLMILVGAVFVYNPADLLAMLTPDSLDKMFWIVVIFAYYMLATLLPIDKLIGKLYPLFGIALLFMLSGSWRCSMSTPTRCRRCGRTSATRPPTRRRRRFSR